VLAELTQGDHPGQPIIERGPGYLIVEKHMA